MRLEESVDSIRICLQFRGSARVQHLELHLCARIQIQCPQKLIGVDQAVVVASAKHLRQAPLCHPSVEFHLKETILGRDIPLCEEHVMQVSGGDMRYSVSISQ